MAARLWRPVSQSPTAGRATDSIFQPGDVEKWRTTTRYGGDHTEVIPPPGQAATGKLTDIRGNTVELRQYHDRTLTGTPDVTTYGYNRKGLLDTITDPAGNQWRTSFDLRGRAIETLDPDRGTTKYKLNNADQMESSTDSRGTTLAYKYDDLGRIVGLFENSTSGTQRAGWTYDTLAKGQPTSSSRYHNGNTYTVATTGYNDLYDRP
jgi:YD repeat-containing protein